MKTCEHFTVTGRHQFAVKTFLCDNKYFYIVESDT